MDKEFLTMLLNIILVLPFILLLIYITLKYGGNKLQSIQNGRFIKVIERVPLTKDSSIMVVKIGDKAYVMSVSASKTEIITELEKEKVEEIENMKRLPQYANIYNFKFLNKVKFKKEDYHE